MQRLFINILWLAVFLATPFFGQQTSLSYEFKYGGKNMYFQNPFTQDGLHFCVEKVLVNGLESSDKISSSAFEIDLSTQDLKIGDSVRIEVIHSIDCLPNVLNPEVISLTPTFKTKGIKVENDSLIWTTTNEQFKLTFIVEQYRWRRWIRIGEVNGVGIPIENRYSYCLKKHFHNGDNKFRIKQVTYSSRNNISPVATYHSTTENVKLFKPEKGEKMIRFSKKTVYQLYDKGGQLVKQGESNIIDLSDLKQDVFYLNYDNTTGEIIQLAY